MRQFATCIRAIDETNKTTKKVAALQHYFDTASQEDKIWCIALLSHRRPKRPVTTTLLRAWAAEVAHISDELFEDSYHIVGDLAETIALLVAKGEGKNIPLKPLVEYIDIIRALKGREETEIKETILAIWSDLPYFECFLFNKILTGAFRIGVSQKLMTRALARSLSLEEPVVAHRLMGNWEAHETTFEELLLSDDGLDASSRPYPFYLAYPFEEEPSSLGDPKDWQAEWKWDGIRGQLIRRMGETFIWTRGEELVTDRYPELMAIAEQLPDGTVLDGEILPYADGLPIDFSQLQKRIGRKTVSKKLLQEIPVSFMAYDLLEYAGEDYRQQAVTRRRKKLEDLMDLQIENLLLSERIRFESWDELSKLRESSRERRVEGMMLKHKDSSYKMGRVKGEVWKWKVEPYTIDAVLTFAMRGHGRRADLYTDYTFGLWSEGKLMTFAKAYSGLTDKELKEIDRFVKKNTLNRFGPVREVKPEIVMELAFEGISRSTRHKSGIATRFPRIKRIRRDKKIEDANTLEDILAILPKEG